MKAVVTKTMKVKEPTHKALTLFKRFYNGLAETGFVTSYDDVLDLLLKEHPLAKDFKDWCNGSVQKQA